MLSAKPCFCWCVYCSELRCTRRGPLALQPVPLRVVLLSEVPQGDEPMQREVEYETCCTCARASTTTYLEVPSRTACICATRVLFYCFLCSRCGPSTVCTANVMSLLTLWRHLTPSSQPSCANMASRYYVATHALLVKHETLTHVRMLTCIIVHLPSSTVKGLCPHHPAPHIQQQAFI